MSITITNTTNNIVQLTDIGDSQIYDNSTGQNYYIGPSNSVTLNETDEVLKSLLEGDIKKFENAGYITITSATKVLIVNSIDGPYLTIEDAIAAAPANSVIEVAPGTYPENLTITKNISIHGSGIGITNISGNVSMTYTGTAEITGTSFTGTFTLNSGNMSMINCWCTGAVTINGTNDYTSFNTSIVPAGGIVPLTANTTGIVTLNSLSLIATNVSAILQTAGILVLSQSRVQNNDATAPALLSSGGYTNIFDSYATNLGGGAALDLNNAGSLELPNVPNAIANVIATGNVDLRGTVTSVSKLHFSTITAVPTGALLNSGSAI